MPHNQIRVAAIILAIAIVVSNTQLSAHADDDTKTDVPLRKVVLFSSGVGYFEHNGKVNENASVDLKFHVDDINDLLKSMVVQDLGGGTVSTVTYGSRDPVSKTLKTFAIDLTSNPTMPELLGQIRGEKITIEGPNKITGTILGVEKRQRKVADNEVLNYYVINLLTENGLRSLPLEGISSISLNNKQLDEELQKALVILALGHSTDKKTVSLSFQGMGERPVRIGYIQETPLWKTSYRLVLNNDKKPQLQGWAIVENATEFDWGNVDLTLISGRPVSFRMDLYQPLYVQRPTVVPELYASLMPQLYDQDLIAKQKAFEGLARNESKKADGLYRDRKELAAKGRPGRAAQQLGQGAIGDYAAPRTPGVNTAMESEEMDMLQSVKSLADAGEVGELFQYKIETPVKLDRQRSAMLPIVNGEIEAKKVSIYNPNVQQKHPMNGLQFVNSTDLHLMQGPITVFDGGTYAGDARIRDMEPNGKRLLSYALDLSTEVASESKSSPDELVSVKINKGTLATIRKYSRTTTYTVKNSGSNDKHVLIEYAKDPNWKLVAPEKPEETTRNQYRFGVDAKPGEPAKLIVKEERIQHQSYTLTNIDSNTIYIYIRSGSVSESVKAALREVIQRKQALSEITRERSQYSQEIAQISKEQSRIRSNMAALDRNSDLYIRYVKKFTTQEDNIEDLRDKIAALIVKENKLRKELDLYLQNLNIG